MRNSKNEDSYVDESLSTNKLQVGMTTGGADKQTGQHYYNPYKRNTQPSIQ